jgi:hypothetical protein
MDMKIKIIGPVMIRGKDSGLIDYQFVDWKCRPISATFQATPDYLHFMEQSGHTVYNSRKQKKGCNGS